ncbi:ABC transporter ATP-binding protein [Brucella sp. NBRC 12950]|jgi:branched-chain amino acid transport system ATP-binding protein|uniref:ABC transporter ATP-binding protein n=1 Tax=Brucella sp. NBRC 12950 TaxID=2994518 RepID=UPI0024A23795|nr:ABC transporter ATP-binding protein [Brucella sp. NBRC 12950]GLU28316.1 ABC transporter ATP-binding protein [Brucella sp. NBRC 12950]
MNILETRNLHKRFGGLHVTNDVNLQLRKGEIHCLIGPNGAGKSTLFALILGKYLPSEGDVLYKGEIITQLKSFDRIDRGISVKFQVPGIFKELSVYQNLEIAVQRKHRGSELKREIERLLGFLKLEDSTTKLAGNLSHGQKQWLEIGMAISLEPELLLLDEPTAGMTPDETFATGEMVQQLNAQGVTVLAVEHDMAFVRQIAQQVTVLHFGKIFAQGSIDDIVKDDRVAAIYLGQADA